MRPRPFGPGYLSQRGSDASFWAGFNEAQAFRPRILPVFVPDRAPALKASMRPRPFGPGYLIYGDLSEFDYCLASMRPRPFGPGYDASSLSWRCHIACFNEAQAFRPRIRPLSWRCHKALADASMRPRPFGPGYQFSTLSVVAYLMQASMRPRPFGPGYIDEMDTLVWPAFLLQ